MTAIAHDVRARCCMCATLHFVCGFISASLALPRRLTSAAVARDSPHHPTTPTRTVPEISPPPPPGTALEAHVLFHPPSAISSPIFAAPAAFLARRPTFPLTTTALLLRDNLGMAPAGALRVHGRPQRGEGHRAAAGSPARRPSYRERDGGGARYIRPGPEEEGKRGVLLSVVPGSSRPRLRSFLFWVLAGFRVCRVLALPLTQRRQDGQGCVGFFVLGVCVVGGLQFLLFVAHLVR